MMNLRDFETLKLQTALGIQFWDSVLARPVSDGLLVRAQRLTGAAPRQRAGRPVTAVQTPSGNYAFFGLHPDERTEVYPLPDKHAVIDVEDPQGRYLPASFEVVIPVDGPFRGRGDWLPRPLMLPEPPAGQDLGVFLWSAPTRLVAPGLAVLYAQLAVGEEDLPPPAPHALVQLVNGGGAVHAVGMADHEGKLTLPMAYPAIPHLTPQPPLRAHQFALSVEVFYEPAAQDKLPGSQVPDLALLLGQAQAQVAIDRNPATRAMTLAAQLPLQFGFEEPAVLRTRSTDPSRRDPYLRIQA